MKKEILLSICIPTYNRCAFLEENILEIIAQTRHDNFQDKIEICVSDNNSSDDTDKMISKISTSNSDIQITYSKNNKNLGPDRNYIFAMNMAQGVFSWLLGSDDLPEQGAIQEIIRNMTNEENVDVLLFNRNDYDIKMQNLHSKTYWLRKDIDTQIFDFSDKRQEKNYYNSSVTLGAVFSYISSIVYKTEIVKRYEFDESFIGTAYAHTFFFFKCLKDGGKLKYLKDHLVKNRLGNDSFGIGYQRQLLDFKGYDFIRKKLFINDTVEFDFMGILKREHPFFMLIHIYCTMKKHEWKTLVPLLIDCGWSVDEISHIEQIGNSPNLYQSRFKQQLKKIILKKN